MLFTLSAWMMADFMAGLFHWFEDRVLTDEVKVPWWLKTIQADNGDHHRRPAAMLRFSEWENIKTSVLVSWPLSALCFWAGLHWMSLAFFFAAFGNLVHRWSHTPASKLPLIVRVVQRSGIFISRASHHKHHYLGTEVIPKEKTTGDYCVMTSWLNPVLDWLGFWNILNRICGV